MASRGLVRACVFTVTLVATAACTDLSGLSGNVDPPPTPDAEAPPPTCQADTSSDPANCGACGRACGAEEVCSSSACVTGCRDRILYVSPTGNDAALGCTKERPKKTIASAVSYVTTARAANHEIHVCAGMFTEHELKILWPLALRGGYDCTTWARLPELPVGGSTVIVPDTQVSAETATLVVTGKDIGPSTVIEGVTVRGDDVRAHALLIENDASPLVTKSVFAARKGANTSGIKVAGSPEIAFCAIDGGEGTSTINTPGSAAIRLFGGAAYVHDNVMHGGKGSSTTFASGSVGMRIGDTGAVRIERNKIYPGSGSTAPAMVDVQRTAAIGIDLQTTVPSSVVTITDNDIRPEPSPTPPPSCSANVNGCATRGISVFAALPATASARIERNRIEPPFPTATGSINLFAINGNGNSGSIEAANNFIHSGVSPTDVGVELRGINVRNGTKLMAVHNTIALGTASGTGIQIDTQGVNDTTAINNLVVASTFPLALVRGFVIGDGSVFKSLANNAVVGDIPFMTCPTCTNPTEIVSTEAAHNALAPASAVGNRRVASACGTDPAASCLMVPACTNAGDCNRSVLTAWDNVSFGVLNIFDAGLTLKPTAPCFVAGGGLTATTTALGAQDFFRTARVAPVSIGAHELAIACP